jgi:hypothetical protein
MSGYFPTNNSCTPCSNVSISCLTCSYNDGANGTLTYNSSIFTCLSCTNGTYLENNTCNPCIANCQVCTSTTICDTCAQGYLFNNATSVCVVAVNCSAVGGCSICDSINGCTQCLSGYNLTNLTICFPICGDGIKLSVEGCDSGTSGNGCSSNCTV